MIKNLNRKFKRSRYHSSDDLSKAVAKKLGVRVTSYLGGGSQGHAYLLDNDMVMKLTNQDSEYYVSTSLVGKKLKHICHIYETYKLINVNCDYRYAIIQEYLDTSETCLTNEFEIDTNINDRARMMIHYKFSKPSVERFNELYNKFPDCKAEFDNYRKVTIACFEAGMGYADILYSNLGMRGDELVLFDLGYSTTYPEKNGKTLSIY